MTRRILIVLLALLGAALVVIGGLSVGWWSQPATPEAPLSAAIGLVEMHVCNAGACSAAPLSKLAPADGVWVRVGTAAYAAAWIAGVLGILLAAAGAARGSWPLLGKTAISAAAGGLVAGVMFLASAPDLAGFRVDASAWMYVGGAPMVLVAGVLALRPAD